MATGIGETLRDARLQRGLSLEDASAETRIRATHLAALEQEDYDRLGGDVYVRGFLKSYAKVLGLDPQPLLQAHHEAVGRRPAPEPPAALPSQPLERAPRRGVGVAVAVVALLAIVGLAVVGDDDPEQVDLDEDTAAEDADSEPEEEPDNAGDTEPTPAAPERGEADEGADGADADPDDGADAATEPADGLAVDLAVTDRDAWVRALVDGDEVFQGTLTPGDSRTFEGEEEVRLRIGDPAAVDLTVNGESVSHPGEAGQPIWLTIDADGEVTVG